MDEDSDKMDAKKVNSELWEAIQKQTDEKLKCLDEKSAELKRTMEKGFRKLDRVAMCVGLIAKKYGIEMKEEGEGE